MKQAKWTIPLSCLILGLTLIGAACQGASSAPPTKGGSDTADSYSAGALYNLGNSYARHGKTALAVLSYERAQLLAPRDPDIQANLRHEQESASLSIPARYEDHFRVLSPNVTYWLGLTGLVTTGVSGLLLALRKSPKTAWRAALGGGVFMMAFTLSNAMATARVMREAVVMQGISASASPISNGVALFTLPPATLVQIQDKHGNFVLIRDSQDRLGWVPRAQITSIITAEGNIDA